MSTNSTPSSTVITTEVWRDVAGHKGIYQVSDLGRLKRLARTTVRKDGKSYRIKEMILNPKGGKFGHKYVALNGNGRIRLTSIHCLVLEAFVGPCPPGLECRHLNGKAWDNRLSNLAWGSHTENMRDRITHGTTNHGVRCPLANKNLNDAVVTKLIRAWETGNYDTGDLMKMFNLSYGTVWTITRGATWKHIKRFAFPKTKKRSKKTP